MLMRPTPPDTRLTIELLRAFLRWNEGRFAHPNADPDSDSVGWRRGNEWWIKPPTWRSIFEPHGLDPVEAARTVKHLDLLRVQDSRTLQAAVKVRDMAVRAYVINETALAEWKPGYSGYNSAQVEVDTSPISLIPSIPAPPDLAGKLEAATSLALDEALGILRMEAQLDDRTFQMVLRAKAGIINTVLTNQVRVDEAKLRQRNADALPALLARIEAALKEG